MRNWLCRGVLVSMALSGCRSGGSSAVTPADFCASVADKECVSVTSKCGSDKAACLTARKAVCMDFANSRQMAPRVFKAANISACVNQKSSVYSTNGIITPEQIDAMNDACEYVFQGDVKPLGTCSVKYDCQGQQICDKRVCATRVVKNKDELCGNPGEICSAGSYCTMVGQAFMCVAKHAIGELCDNNNNPCLEALRCLRGTCAARATAGVGCTSDDDCGIAVPYCDPYIGNRCDQGLTFVVASAACAAFGGSPPAAGTGGAGGAGGAVTTGDASGSGGASGDVGDAGDDAAATD